MLPPGPISIPGQGFPAAVVNTGTWQGPSVQALRPVAAPPPGIPADVRSILASWPDNPRRVAEALTRKYGKPDEICSAHLAWYRKGPWHISMVQKEEVLHNFPTPHTDFLIQAVQYPVDPDVYDDLAKFNGSAVVERTWGLLGGMCGDEAMNLMIVNLAHEIAAGKLGWKEARAKLVELTRRWISGAAPAEATGLRFSLPPAYHGNADVAAF